MFRHPFSIVYVKALIGTFNQEKALIIGAFYVIVKLQPSFEALVPGEG